VGEDESNEEAEESDSEDEEESEPEQTLRRSERLKGGMRKPSRYVVHTKLKSGAHNAEETNAMIERAEREEIELVFRDLEAYIDASFAVHMDGKSHLGVIVLIGGVGVLFMSRKQKCVSKSPTKAELIALSDNVGLVELFNEFLGFVLNSEVRKPIVYQDNTSVISLVTIGGGIVRTKHLRARMCLVKEAISQQKLEIRHVLTADMIAMG
jgi:hypothetical protein